MFAGRGGNTDKSELKYKVAYVSWLKQKKLAI